MLIQVKKISNRLCYSISHSFLRFWVKFLQRENKALHSTIIEILNTKKFAWLKPLFCEHYELLHEFTFFYSCSSIIHFGPMFPFLYPEKIPEKFWFCGVSRVAKWEH